MTIIAGTVADLEALGSEKFPLSVMAETAFDEAYRIYNAELGFRPFAPLTERIRRAHIFAAISKTIDAAMLDEPGFRSFITETIRGGRR